ncbi:MAG: tRNA (adenosine(37)-N6)-threonylcarbamoyltransferase complex ATPase subunit type 1 TsaE [Bacteroidetes bacterium]|nr:tRNA (adenosine(37)-N6)-threonylcarbamoyltransferase complex ATPase subunit type 1 TsaE [Bacteroidota bacterium]
MKEIHTYRETETRRAGRDFALRLPADALVAFSGDLGTGKTAFIRGICEAFDCADQVSSPSFTIVNEYRGNRRVLHCDLYRLDTIDDMLQIGLDELLSSGGTTLVEWAERALPLLPFPRWEIAAHHGATPEQRSYSIVHRESEADASLLYSPQELVVRRIP